MEPLLCYPEQIPPVLASALRMAGYRIHCFSRPEQADADEGALTGGGWLAAVVSAADDLGEAIAFCRSLRRRDSPLAPLLLVVRSDQLPELRLREDLFDDFCVLTNGAEELAVRLDYLLRRQGTGSAPELIEHGPLQLNLETYQAAIAGRALDLTYMEYELLRFLAGHPAKVFTRETLLSRVWGYEYYGGARTVDVHIRRLRAKLGEEHAHLIQTVRSVGYRFGQVGHFGTAPGR